MCFFNKLLNVAAEPTPLKLLGSLFHSIAPLNVNDQR